MDFLDMDSNGTVVYDEPIVHHHTPNNDYNLIRKITGIHPTIITSDAKLV